MYKIELKGLKETISKLDNIAKQQVPFAVSRTINDLLPLIKAAEVAEMTQVFDRPTPYTLNSIYMKSSTKQNLQGEVWLKNTGGHDTPAVKFLGPEVYGGERNTKRFEKAVRAVGVLPEGMYIAPGEAAKLDAYGNIAASQIIQILSWFKAFREAGYRANMTDKTRTKRMKGTKKNIGFAYFVGRPGGGRLPLGIYQRFQFAHGSAIKPIMLFVSKPMYRSRFDFFARANKVINNNVAAIFDRRMEEAIRTAK